MSIRLRIATRKSRLALAQTEWVASRLRALRPGLHIEIVTVVSEGDADRDSPLTRMSGTGVFTKALQEALVEGRADLAVHSLKDLPTEEPEGLVLASTPRRAEPRDVLVTRERVGLDGLAPSAVVGTGSPRRRSQLLERRGDLEVADIRGNVDTRVRKVREGTVDAAILAAAGLERLGMADVVDEVLEFVPAPGQGALALECRADDEETRETVSGLDHPDTAVCVEAERAWLAATGAGCHSSAGALAQLDGDSLELTWYLEGRSGTARDVRQHATALGESCAKEALA